MPDKIKWQALQKESTPDKGWLERERAFSSLKAHKVSEICG